MLSCSSMCSGRGCWSINAYDCQHCPNGQALRYGKCVPSCNFNTNTTVYFSTNLDTSRTTDLYGCLACDSSCAACVGQTAQSCSACYPGYKLRLDGSCQTACVDSNPGQYVDSLDRCQLCSPDCRRCNITSTICTTCSSTFGLFLYSNASCLASCPAGTFAQSTPARVCAQCDQTCATCVDLGGCTSCNAPRYLYGTQCVTSCPPGLFNSTANGVRSCINCAVAVRGGSNVECIICSDCQRDTWRTRGFHLLPPPLPPHHPYNSYRRQLLLLFFFISDLVFILIYTQAQTYIC